MPVTTAVILGSAQAAKGVYDTIKAGSQRKAALKKYAENPYRPPQAQIDAVNKSATLAQGSKMAGQDILQTNVGARTGEGIGAVKRAAQSPSQVLASTIDLYRNQQAQQQQLDLSSANDYRTRQQGYINALTTLSGYQDKAFQYNTMFPIQSQLNYAGGLEASGQQNIAAGVSGIANAYANDQYLKGLNTSPTNGMQAGTAINPIGISQLPSQQATQGLMPMNYRAPYWGNGVPDNSIQQRQGNYF